LKGKHSYSILILHTWVRQRQWLSLCEEKRVRVRGYEWNKEKKERGNQFPVRSNSQHQQQLVLQSAVGTGWPRLYATCICLVHSKRQWGPLCWRKENFLDQKVRRRHFESLNSNAFDIWYFHFGWNWKLYPLPPARSFYAFPLPRCPSPIFIWPLALCRGKTDEAIDDHKCPSGLPKVPTPHIQFMSAFVVEKIWRNLL
jgi:hypothetical protein